MLFLCLLISAKHAMSSQLKLGKFFWLAATLIFFSALRRELSFVPELVVPEGFMLLGKTYEWWEDSILLIVILIALGSLAYAWRYLWAVLKGVPLFLYVITSLLLIIQYMGENSIGFAHDAGMVTEEVAEAIIYIIALLYLWRFKLIEFDSQLAKSL